jgi:hypothetical protein
MRSGIVPSMAPATMSGARNAQESVAVTCRCDANSSSHRRALAMVSSKVARVSARMGRLIRLAPMTSRRRHVRMKGMWSRMGLLVPHRALPSGCPRDRFFHWQRVRIQNLRIADQPSRRSKVIEFDNSSQNSAE